MIKENEIINIQDFLDYEDFYDLQSHSKKLNWTFTGRASATMSEWHLNCPIYGGVKNPILDYNQLPEIFRPIFSHTRQKLLDKVHYGKKEEDEDKGDDYSIIKPNLRYARNKYLSGFVRKKKLPMDCIKIILSFIHNNL